jgi:hypothetical protein
MNHNQQIAQALCSNDGIMAVMVYDVDDHALRLADGYTSNMLNVSDALATASALFRLYGYREPLRICALAGDEAQSICCFKDGDKIAIVMAHTGHRILKSLRRMTQRALRRKPNGEAQAVAVETGAL